MRLLAALPKLKRWASNWVCLMLRLFGPRLLHFADRAEFRQIDGLAFDSQGFARLRFDFDGSLGFPGEGPSGICTNIARRPKPCRWNLNTGSHLSAPACVCSLLLPSGLLQRLVFWACFVFLWGASSVQAMPLFTATPGETRKAALRSLRPPLQPGRPVTEATTRLRARYWLEFEGWTRNLGIDVLFMLEHRQQHIDELNILLTKYGRLLYQLGKSYNQYAEIREPKSRYTFARHQSAKVDSSDFAQVLELAFSGLKDGVKLWPFSAQTLRARFRSVLAALRLPTVHTFCLDLGSLRSGGAAFIIQATEDSELCRRRGRWASMKMMDVYVQETMAIQCMKLIPPSSKQMVLQFVSLFGLFLQKACHLKHSRASMVSASLQMKELLSMQ